MHRWLVTTTLGLGLVGLAGCEQASGPQQIQAATDNPVHGVWFLQAIGSTPIAIDHVVRFDLQPNGSATYLRGTPDAEDTQRFTLSYKLQDDTIAFDSGQSNPAVPRFTGRYTLDQQTLTIFADEGEWVLTRAKFPGGDLEQARRFEQARSQVQPLLIQVQSLAYACSTFTSKHPGVSICASALFDAGVVKPEQFLRESKDGGLPRTFSRLEPTHQRVWLDANADFAFLSAPADAPPATTIVVCELPQGPRDASVVVGMANGATFEKPTHKVERLLLNQLGELPPRWTPQQSSEARVGLEPLSD